MIKLKNKDTGKVILINKKHIIYACHNDGLETVVYLTDDNVFIVKETLVEVLALFNRQNELENSK